MKIAIAGYGLEGESNYRYYSLDPTNEITIVDQKKPDIELPIGVPTIIGEDTFGKLQDFDLVIRTAGLAPGKINTNGKIWSATNEFFAKCPADIIGVTGSKGKGTVASLIARVLEAAGNKVWLVGNIGKAALNIISEVKPEDIVVYELSSFQLWDLEDSPHIAIVLFIEQEHQDVHSSMAEYVDAKANIGRYQSREDTLIYNQSNQYANHIATHSSAKAIGYPNRKSAHVEDGYFYYNEQKICSVSELQLIGNHNQDNAIAAIDAIWEYTQDVNAIKIGLRSFKGLPHRLYFVRENNGVRYYDDSIATTPTAVIAALRSFSGPEVLILGGSSKGSDFSELARELTSHAVKAIISGDEADNIVAACRKVGFLNFEIINNSSMDNLVLRATELAEPGGIVLLSPACASFGLYKNYIDRGEQFIKAVNKL